MGKTYLTQTQLDNLQPANATTAANAFHAGVPWAVSGPSIEAVVKVNYHLVTQHNYGNSPFQCWLVVTGT